MKIFAMMLGACTLLVWGAANAAEDQPKPKPKPKPKPNQSESEAKAQAQKEAKAAKVLPTVRK